MGISSSREWRTVTHDSNVCVCKSPSSSSNRILAPDIYHLNGIILLLFDRRVDSGSLRDGGQSSTTSPFPYGRSYDCSGTLDSTSAATRISQRNSAGGVSVSSTLPRCSKLGSVSHGA